MSLTIQFNLGQGTVIAEITENNLSNEETIYVSRGGYPNRIGSKIGSGAEGTVYLINHQGRTAVLKIYSSTDPNKKVPSDEKIEKLRELLKLKLPPNILAPKGLIESRGEICGYWMEYAGKGAILFNDFISDPKTFTTRDYMLMFQKLGETLGKLHALGIRVVDINPLGVMLSPDRSEVLLIDTDSFLISGIPSEVYSPEYIHPDLLGKDIRNCNILPGHDNGSAINMLFELVFKAKPFDGFVKGFKTLEKRAVAKIWIFDKQHKIVLPGDLLKPLELVTDDLIAVFRAFILNGYTGQWPREVIQDCINSMIKCSNCNNEFTIERQQCPHCKTNNLRFRKISKGWDPTSLAVDKNTRASIRVNGKILQLKAFGEKIAILHTDYKTFFITTVEKSGKKERVLFKFRSSSKVDLSETKVSVVEMQQGNQALIRIVDYQEAELRPVYQQTTSIKGLNPIYAFGKSFWIVSGGYLLQATQLPNGKVKEEKIFQLPPQAQLYSSIKSDCTVLAIGMNGRYRFQLVDGRFLQNLGTNLRMTDIEQYQILFEEDYFVIRRVFRRFNQVVIRCEEFNLRGLTTKPMVEFITNILPGNLGEMSLHDHKIYASVQDGIYIEDLETRQTQIRSYPGIQAGTRLEPFKGNFICVSDNSASIIKL